VSVATEDY